MSGPVWTLALADPAAVGLIAELSDVRGFTLVRRLDGPDELTRVTLDGDAETATEVVDLATDLLLWRRDAATTVLLHRGRIVSSVDTLTADRHDVALTTRDYRGLLATRHLQADVTFTTADEEAIGWGIIAAAQAETGGDLGIVRAGTATGTTRDRTYLAGQNVGTILEQLGRVEGGPDWDVGPDLTYRAWPSRGGASTTVLEYGATVVAATRRPDPSSFANAVAVTGEEAAALGRVTRTTVGLATDPRGRWDAEVGFPSVTTAATLAEHADGELANRERQPAAWTVQLAPGLWTPDTLGVGDTVRLVVTRGRLAVDRVLRVHRLDVAVDLTTDAETVTAHLDALPLDALEHARTIAADRRRLARMEAN